MWVDTKWKSILIKVVNRVEVLEESITNQEEIFVLTWQSAFMDDEVAFIVVGLIKVLLWIYFKHVVTHLETNWLQFALNFVAGVGYMTEGLIWSAIKVWDCCLPFVSNLIEYIWWDRELWATSVNDSRVWSIFAWLLHWSLAIEHTLTFKSPGSKPILEVLECLKAMWSSHNLTGVIPTKQCIRGLTHFFWSNTETHHGSVDDAVVLERPQVMELLLFHVFVWWQPQNTIWIMSKSLWLIQSQELKEGTLVIFEFKTELQCA